MKRLTLIRKIISPVLCLGMLFLSENLFAASRYWVGGTGTWNASSTTNWAATSGGASGASVPTSADDVYFDANSFSANSQTVTIAATVDCLSMSWTGATTTYTNPTLTFSSSVYDLNVYGSLTLISGMTFTFSSSYIYFKSTAAGRTITTAGKNMPTTYFNGSGGGWTFQDAYSQSSKSFNVQAGTVNTGGFTVSTPTSITVSGGTLNLGASSVTTSYINVSSGAIDFGSSSVSLTGSSSSDELTLNSGATVTAGTATITFTGASNSVTAPIEVYLGTKTVYNLSFPSGKHIIKLYDGGTTNNVTLNSNNVVLLESTKTFTLNGTVTATGDCQNYIIIKSTLAGSAATISTTAAQSWSYIQLKDITKAGAGSITCDYCANAGTNTSVTFTNTYVARTLYWRGTSGTGNWGTGSNWTANADGTSSGNTCVPTIVDNINFDANSFDAASQTVTVDNVMTFNSMNWTGTTNSPTFTNSTGYHMYCTGSITLISGIGTFTNSGEVIFNGTGSQLLTCGGKILTSGATRFYGSGTTYLEDDAYLGTVHIGAGTLDVQNQAATTVYNMYVTGDWWHTAGTFTPRTDATKYVIFNHASSDQYIQSAETFYNLQVNKSTTTSKVYTYAAQTITNELKVTSGWFRVYVYTTTVSGSVTMASNGTIYGLTGTLTYSNNSATNFGFSEGTITVDGMTLNIGSSGTHTLTSLVVGDAASNSATLTVSGGTLNVVDQLRVKSDGIMNITGGTVNIKTNTTNGGTAGIAKWQIDASGQFKQSGGTINLLGAADNNTTNALSFSTTATFTPANITAGTVVLQSTTSTYDYPVDFGGQTLFNLTVNQASRTFTQTTNSLTLKGTFTITSGTYNANGLAMNVAGNWANSSTFTSGSSTVTFNGSSAQTISGASATTFNNVTLNNSSGLTITKGPTINGTFTFTAGNVTASTSTEPLTIETSGSVSGAADAKCVIGYCKKNTNSTSQFTFPVGSSTTLRTIAVTPAGTGATSYLARYNSSGQGTYAYDQGNGTIDHVSKKEYWDLDRSGASPQNCYIALTYNANSVASASYANLIVGHYNSGLTKWESTGGTFTVSGNATSGTVTTNSYVTSFSPFTLGSSNTGNPLPIQLLSFDAVKLNETVNLTWKTASEVNNDYFTVERSADGREFYPIERVEGAGNSNNLLQYNLMDYSPLNGWSYYRLKQTDYDGQYSYSQIRQVAFEKEANPIINIYPNPNGGQNMIVSVEGISDNENSLVSIDIINLLGEKVYSKALSGKLSQTNLVFNNQLSPGIYTLVTTINNRIYNSKFVVK